MSQPPNKRRRNKLPESIDWRELASGPALRGLSDVLATPADVARERAARRMSLEGISSASPLSEGITPTVGEAPIPTTGTTTPSVAEAPTVGVSPLEGVAPPTAREGGLPLAEPEEPTAGDLPADREPPTVGVSTSEGESSEAPTTCTAVDSPTVGDTPITTHVFTSPTTNTSYRVNPAFSGTPSPLHKPSSKTPTVGVTPPLLWVDSTGAVIEAKRVQRVNIAQQSMTLGEERFYQNVWHARESDGVTKDGPRSKVFSLGYDRLAKLVRLDEKSVRMLIPKLVTKRIIEILAGEISAARIGRTYRIFSYEQILERQRAANLLFIVKKGRAVEFVTAQCAAGEGITPTVDAYPTESVGGIAANPVGLMPTPLVTNVDTLSSQTSSTVAAALARYGSADDDAVRAIIANSRRIAPDATCDEIVHFIHEKGSVVLNGRIGNPIAFLIVYVPKCFAGDALIEHRRQQREKQQREVAEALAASQWLEGERAAQERVLDDPNASTEDKKWARKFLQDCGLDSSKTAASGGGQ